MANRALLVGINKYRIPGADLNGCVNDVTNVRDVLLKDFGFTVKGGDLIRGYFLRGRSRLDGCENHFGEESDRERKKGVFSGEI